MTPRPIWATRRAFVAVARGARQVASADRSGVTAEPLVALGDEEDRMPPRVVVEACVRFGLPGKDGVDAEKLGVLAGCVDPELGDPA